MVTLPATSQIAMHYFGLDALDLLAEVGPVVCVPWDAYKRIKSELFAEGASNA